MKAKQLEPDGLVNERELGEMSYRRGAAQAAYFVIEELETHGPEAARKPAKAICRGRYSKGKWWRRWYLDVALCLARTGKMPTVGTPMPKRGETDL